ncbi:actin-like ATPase domain-containing protein [Choiromyces venosus 120613-1]|uniref:Actin-like ATPase domain-containing protein n=1 Tax=Choiromyces venosus 120613-1 TaxID=1336337 RepID=A0A3N4K717_9PEZI|nr:actin-like ATPase domain-containing protein [Choiromyces venosus 120613-1]
MRPISAPPVALTGLLLLSVSSLASASAAVLGIDFGQEFIKAALVKPGIPLEIVLTKDTKRKEVAAVGFKPANNGKEGEFAYPERLYGVDAFNLAARFPHDVYPGLKKVMGQRIMDDSVTAYSARNPALSIIPDVLRSTVAFQSPSAPLVDHSAGVFTVEELLAMQFKSIVYNAEVLAGANTRIRDVVFTVPTFLKAEERNSLKLAAELAGLKVMRFVSDGLAVGINYATTRTFNESSPEYHIVYDMGAGSTTATVLRFQGRSVKDVGRFNKTVQEVTVLGIGYDTELGGDLFNQKIFEILLDDFVNSPKAKKLLEEDPNLKNTVRTNGRAASKLWKEATRVRQILSANTDTIASIESLYKEIDFRSSKITRAAFEELLAQYEARITKPITDAISNANIALNEVNTLIVHGGAVRTPFVGKKIEDIMGGIEKISKQVNPDESAVFGATFKGAAESGAFKVKEIRTQDIGAFGVSIKYKKDAEAKKETVQQIFPFYSKAGNEKVIPFSRDSEFTFSTFHNIPPRINDPNQKPGQELLETIQTSNLTDSVKKLQDDFGCAEKDIVTKFGIILNPKDSLPKVIRSWVECEVEVASDAPKKDAGGAFEDVKGFFGYGKKKDAASKSTKSADSEPKVIRRIEKIAVKYTITKDGFPSIPEKDKTALILKIRGFDKHDKERKNLEEARNNLEAYTYRARGYLSDDAFIAVSTEEQREKLDAMINEASDWLYGDGYTAGLKEVHQKIKQLEALETPISKRRAEKDSLPEALQNLNSILNSMKGFIEREESLAEAQTDDYYTFDLEPLKKSYEKESAWAEEKSAAQEKLQLHEGPVITSEEINAKAKELTTELITSIHTKRELDDMRERSLKKAAAAAEKEAKEAEAKAKAGAEAAAAQEGGEAGEAENETKSESEEKVEEKVVEEGEETAERKRDEL